MIRHAGELRAARQVTVDTTRVGAAQVHGDAAQIARAVGNIADNAARHATSGVTFSLTELRRHRGARRERRRAGHPTPSARPGVRTLHPPRRLSPGATEGTGLGLAIAREVIERHGSTLTIDPDQSPGARFITLPLHAATLPATTTR